MQKYPPISGKLSIISYLKQNAIEFHSHLTLVNGLMVEKTYSLRQGGQGGRSPQISSYSCHLVLGRKQNTVVR